MIIKGDLIFHRLLLYSYLCLYLLYHLFQRYLLGIKVTIILYTDTKLLFKAFKESKKLLQGHTFKLYMYCLLGSGLPKSIPFLSTFNCLTYYGNLRVYSCPLWALIFVQLADILFVIAFGYMFFALLEAQAYTRTVGEIAT
jgi:hypothetical protein